MPGIFNLGGDLHLFAELIRRRDRAALTAYARACVAEVHANSMALDLPIITMSLVQGDALGGGFEAALSSNVIIAERSAKFGLPEIMFNLFPGMGAYNFIARRTNAATAERMIMSGRIYTGAELYDMGIVDVLAEDGRGEEALNDYVRKNARRHAAHRAIFQARQRVNPITLQDLNGITDLWVDTAMTLSPMDLKMMERLVAAQGRRRARAEVRRGRSGPAHDRLRRLISGEFAECRTNAGKLGLDFPDAVVSFLRQRFPRYVAAIQQKTNHSAGADIRCAAAQRVGMVLEGVEIAAGPGMLKLDQQLLPIMQEFVRDLRDERRIVIDRAQLVQSRDVDAGFVHAGIGQVAGLRSGDGSGCGSSPAGLKLCGSGWS